MPTLRQSFLILDRTALLCNLAHVAAYAPGSRILAMVKADGYGHGLVWVAQTLEPYVQGFGVACLLEAKRLRQVLTWECPKPIVLMSGFLDQAELQFCLEHRIDVVLHSAHQLSLLQHISSSYRLGVWIKVNTGMNRLGFSPAVMGQVWSTLSSVSDRLDYRALMTHFAESDSLKEDKVTRPMQVLRSLSADIPLPLSAANSGAILAWPNTHADWVRPGIALYGASPFVDQPCSQYGLKPVMTYSARVIALQDCAKGSSIGYGGLFTCPYPMKVAMVGTGYADGYPRTMPQGTHLTHVNGQVCPLIGRVSMDILAVDLTHCPACQIGDELICWGQGGLPVETVAQSVQTLGYELMTGLSKIRLTRLES